MTNVPPVAPGAAADPEPTTQPGSSPRPGQLVPMWRLVLTLGWIGVFFAFAAVWKASEEIGIATWWLGPRSAPQPVAIRVLPFVLAIAVGAVVVANRRAAVWVSLVGSALVGLIACFDITRSGGLALIEFAIALAIALVTVAAFSGRYRQRAGEAAAAVAVVDESADDVFVVVSDDGRHR